MPEIIQQNSLTPDNMKQLESLISLCSGYKPFIDCNTPYYLIFCPKQPNILVGFLSFISIDSTDGQAHCRETEVTALVHPDWRNKGIFTALLTKAREDILSLFNQPNSIIAALPEYLTTSDICRGYAYSELLLECGAPVSAVISPDNMDDYYDYETFFTDDGADFLLYCKDEDEPCAVCSLDYCGAYTNIYGVYVDEERRNKKIGSLLMQSLLEKYFKKYNVPLILNVRNTNTAAVKLYKKFGFTEKSKINYYYL